MLTAEIPRNIHPPIAITMESESGRESTNKDLDLFAKVKKDDSRSFEILFERYYGRLCGFAYQFTKNKENAEEIVSTLFSTIWLKRNDIHIEQNFKSYLYKSVRNQSLNYLKAQKTILTDIDDMEIESNGTYDHPGNSLELKELETSIENLISSMPRQRQRIFRMSRIECLKYAEIADILCISVNTVQNHMVEAVKYMSGNLPKVQAVAL